MTSVATPAQRAIALRAARWSPRRARSAPATAIRPMPSQRHQLALDAHHVRGQVLQRLEHPEEIPLGPDAGGRRRKRIGLDAELPREEGRQRRRAAPAPASSRTRRAARNAARTGALACAGPFAPQRRSTTAARSCRAPGRARGAAPRSTVAIIGRIATCMPKKPRQRGAGDVGAAAHEAAREARRRRESRPAMSVPTRVAKYASSFHGSR